MNMFHRVITIFLLALLLPALVAPARATATASHSDMAAIDRYVEEQLATLGIPGAAFAIVQGDQIVHLQHFGRADDTGRPMTPQTPLLIGSLTKSFTAVAIMQLAEQGKVELDAPVQRYIPWFSIADPAASARMTIRHLLTHTSGISGRGEAAWLLQENTAADAIERQVRALAAVELTAQPGATWQYASANYVILGLIIETVSGQRYEQYIQEQIFAPLGMSNSFSSPEAARAAGLAEGHQFWFGRARPAQLPYPRGLLPAGYLAASAEDMGRYLIAHLNGGSSGETQILEPASIDELHRPAIAIDEGLWGAMGWGVGDFDGAQALQHDGNTASYRAEMWLLPEQRLGFVLLMNASNELQTTPTRMLGQGIAALLLERTAQPIALNPGAHLFYGAIIILTGIQLLMAARSARTLFRWRATPPAGSPWRRIALPAAVYLLAAFLFLAVIPAIFLGGSLDVARLLAPDLGSILGIAGTVALGWAVARTILAVRLLQH